jgi:hypothetical protein
MFTQVSLTFALHQQLSGAARKGPVKSELRRLNCAQASQLLAQAAHLSDQSWLITNGFHRDKNRVMPALKL